MFLSKKNKYNFVSFICRTDITFVSVDPATLELQTRQKSKK